MQALRNENARAVFRERNGEATSFGPLGYIAPASAGRLKGFIGYANSPNEKTGTIRPIDTVDKITFISDVVSCGIEKINESNGEITRLAIRTIVDNRIDAYFRARMLVLGAEVEATIPINDQYSVYYIGYNASSRRLSEGSRAEILTSRDLMMSRRGDEGRFRNVMNTLFEDRLSQGDITTRVADNTQNTGQRTSNFTQYDYEKIASLLQSFDYTPEQSISVSNSPDNIIGVIDRSGSSIIGMVVAERVPVMLNDGRTIDLIELTDAVVSREHAERRLYLELSQRVLGHIAEQYADRDYIVYAESNLEDRGLLSTIALQNREVSGILPNHIPINGQLKSFTVTYFTREQLNSQTEHFAKAEVEAVQRAEELIKIRR